MHETTVIGASYNKLYINVPENWTFNYLRELRL